MSKPIGPKELALKAQREQNAKLAKAHALMVQDGCPPALLRAPVEKKPQQAAQTPPADLSDKSLLATTARVAQIPAALTAEQQIKKEADARWRNWVPNGAELTRPALRSFIAKVKRERKDADKAAKAAAAFHAKAEKFAAEAKKNTPPEAAATPLTAQSNEENIMASSTAKKKSSPSSKRASSVRSSDRKRKSAKSNAARPTRAAKGGYDWDAAKAAAEAGKIPTMPPFQSYRPHIQDFHDLAKKSDVAGINEYSKRFVDRKGSRANMFRYRDLLLLALKK